MSRANFDYAAPATVEEAVALLQGGPDGRVLAGGQSLLTDVKLGKARPRLLVDLGRVAGLDGIEPADGGLRLGAMVTLDALAASNALKSAPSALADAVAVFGDPQVRNRATVGGALANLTPGADLPAVTIACDVTVEVAGPGGFRPVAAEDLFGGPSPTGLEAGEVVVALGLPATETGTGSAYEKMAHPGSRYAVCGVATTVAIDAGGSVVRCRVAVAGIAAGGVRLPAVEAAFTGRRATAGDIAAAAASVVDEAVVFPSDLATSAEYRAHLTEVLTGRSLHRSAERAGRVSP